LIGQSVLYPKTGKRIILIIRWISVTSILQNLVSVNLVKRLEKSISTLTLYQQTYFLLVTPFLFLFIFRLDVNMANPPHREPGDPLVPGVARFLDLEAGAVRRGGGGGGPAGPKSRNWVFTWNNWSAASLQHIATVIASNSIYVGFQPERGVGGTPHLQGVVVFKNPRYS